MEIPNFLQDRSLSEQDSLLQELLSSEISAAGVAVLSKQGKFGSLRSLFPSEADAWATAFGVPADQCVAFRMSRSDITAELVFHRSGDIYNILRCNNVRQMADEISQP